MTLNDSVLLATIAKGDADGWVASVMENLDEVGYVAFFT